MNKFFAFVKWHVLSLVFFLLAVLVMGRIFAFSAEVSDKSQQTSEGVCYFIAKVIVGGFSSLTEEQQAEKIEEMVPVVRKVAHFSIYAALGALLTFSVCSYLAECKKRIRYLKGGTAVSIFCLLYAATDEFHQLFVDGRSGSVRDVIIDLCGSVCGVLFAAAMTALFVKFINKQSAKKSLH